ncbi:hypothetical protein Vretifemale_15180, partial [Volvox reticuliferus]
HCCTLPLPLAASCCRALPLPCTAAAMHYCRRCHMLPLLRAAAAARCHCHTLPPLLHSAVAMHCCCHAVQLPCAAVDALCSYHCRVLLPRSAAPTYFFNKLHFPMDGASKLSKCTHMDSASHECQRR